ncbi:MAG: signal peptide protein [Verrucomicrobiaceae bacterium]|nr:signal peptide protein [Verrucomicrobiaceae bacterium]
MRIQFHARVVAVLSAIVFASAAPAEDKTEPAKVAPVKVEPTKGPTAKAEPPKVEPAKPKPAKVEPAKAQPAKAEPPKASTAKAEPPKVEPPKPKPELPKISTTQPAPKLVQQFLTQYCADCHDTDVQKGDRNFDAFALPLKSANDLIDARDIIDQLTLKEMPPKKADQPRADERLAMIRALRDASATAFRKIESTGSRTVMRRLSSREYENTLAVLFGRRVDTLGLTADFPKEITSEHIDTVGKSLVTSGFLVDQYFQSANHLVEARLGKPAMEPKSWHFDGHFVQYEELQGPHKAAFNFRYLNLYEQPNTETRQGGYGHIEDFLQGVPVAGFYDLEVEAQAMFRDTHYDPKIFGIDFSEPFVMGIVPGDITKGHIHYPQPIEPLLASSVVPDDKPTVLKFRVWLEAGQTPRFIFPNGPHESRASVITVNQRYKDEFKDQVTRLDVSRTTLLREGQLPHIRISDIKINGPVPEKGGSIEEIAVFGKGGFHADHALDQLNAFAAKAYRRPLTDADRQPIRALYDKRIAEQAAPRQAALDALKLILCSPSFLYLSEITEESAKTLQPYDLATRLSFALWAVPPDATLLAAAKSGTLTQDAELKKQIQRMLADERINGFVNGFLDSWLNLRDLGSQPPPRETNRAYYAEDLPTSMKTETRLFFRDLLTSNGSVSQFINADHTFVDKKLAKLYDLPEKDTLRLADGFKKVSVKGNNHRGGLLGMAAVLTVSANGVETSPVTRGVWVSENILGAPPPPPPDVVPAIDTDVTGTKTIRDRLAKHRADPVCAECHRRIDPFGFSLENFDPVGRWRVNYPKPKDPKAPAPKIDASGELPSGDTYKDFVSFKKLIGETREELFTRHLIRQVLTYSSGRKMEFADSFTIDELNEKLKKQGLGLRSLITECLMSEIFRSR